MVIYLFAEVYLQVELFNKLTKFYAPFSELQYHGGTNFGRTAGGPFIATSYDYDAPIDEYGMQTSLSISSYLLI